MRRCCIRSRSVSGECTFHVLLASRSSVRPVVEIRNGIGQGWHTAALPALAADSTLSEGVRGMTGAEGGLAACLAAIDAREAGVCAWTHVDRAAAPSADGPLAGLAVGVKDIVDVAGMPCERGSPIYAGRVPTRDAACVARLREAGAAVLGKTVMTEFAAFAPPVTSNPHDAARTPGGSSSESAAAVACGMADVALGTQTAGGLLAG